MKMIIAIIGSEDADDLVYELNQHSFFVTKLSTMGGFLKKKSTTLMLGVEDERVEDAISIIKNQIGYLKFLNPFSVAKVQLIGLYRVDNWVL